MTREHSLPVIDLDLSEEDETVGTRTSSAPKLRKLVLGSSRVSEGNESDPLQTRFQLPRKAKRSPEKNDPSTASSISKDVSVRGRGSKSATKTEHSVQPDVSLPPDGVTHLACDMLMRWKQLEVVLRCDICKDFMEAPVSLKCSHTFCSYCIRRYLELDATQQVCPVCKTPASNTDIRADERLGLIIANLGRDDAALRRSVRVILKTPSRIVVKKSPPKSFARLGELMSATSGSVVDGDRHTAEGDRLQESDLRVIMPTYKMLNDKELKDLLKSEGISVPSSFSREAYIRIHKDFILSYQAAIDAYHTRQLSAPISKTRFAQIYNRRQQKTGPSSVVLNSLLASSTESERELARMAQQALQRRVAFQLQSKKALIDNALARE